MHLELVTTMATLWNEFIKKRSLCAIGHSKAVRDICFNNTGTQFLSAGYDRYLKLWDSETGRLHYTDQHTHWMSE